VLGILALVTTSIVGITHTNHLLDDRERERNAR
jgi:hypothetical protein